MWGGGGGGGNIFFLGGGGKREGYGGHIWLKTPKIALISEYLAADSSADALAIINIGKFIRDEDVRKCQNGL